MKPVCNVAPLVERFFTERLIRQQDVSAHTIASYRDTFRLLFKFAKERLRKTPSGLTLDELDAPFVGAFLTDLETKRGTSVTTRNLRLTAIRSFFRFVPRWPLQIPPPLANQIPPGRTGELSVV